ncbi:hypothetical protein Tco_0668652, partial [Tanacetum coccineum]
VVCGGYGRRLFESEGGWGRGIKEKQHGSADVNVVSSAINEPSTTALIDTTILTNSRNVDGNLIGRSPQVVKDGIDAGFVDLKVVEGVNKPVSTIPKYFSSLVTNKVVTCVYLDVHLIFGCSLYGYFMGKRVSFLVVENYVKNAWKKFGLVRVMINSKGFFFFKFASIEDVNGVPIWVKFYDIPIVAFTTDDLSVMATKLELKEDMVIVIPNMKDDREVLHTVTVEYKWEPPRCDVCMVFGHDDMLSPKWSIEKPKKQHINLDGFQHTSSSHGTNVGSKIQFKPKKPIFQVVSKKNSASSSDTKKNSKVSKKVTSFNNPFDVLNTIKEGDELGSNEGSKLVLLNDDGKPLKASKSTLLSSSNVVSKKVDNLVNEDNDSEVEEKENHGEDPYDDDDFDDLGLTDAQMRFANAFDINLCDQLR